MNCILFSYANCIRSLNIYDSVSVFSTRGRICSFIDTVNAFSDIHQGCRSGGGGGGGWMEVQAKQFPHFGRQCIFE